MQTNTIRAFIALELPEPICQKAVDLLIKIRAEAPQGVVRWVKAEGLHLTLRFLGDIPSTHLQAFSRGLVAISEQIPPILMTLRKIDAFPNPQNPRVVWVGIEADDEWTHLQAEVERLTCSLGYAPEERRFSPHLTLGRIRQEASGDGLNKLVTWLSDHQHVDLGECMANVIRLYRSELKPGGSVYTPLAEVQLRV
jgi:2'-5' RNA ligase